MHSKIQCWTFIFICYHRLFHGQIPSPKATSINKFLVFWNLNFDISREPACIRLLMDLEWAKDSQHCQTSGAYHTIPHSSTANSYHMTNISHEQTRSSCDDGAVGKQPIHEPIHEQCSIHKKQGCWQLIKSRIQLDILDWSSCLLPTLSCHIDKGTHQSQSQVPDQGMHTNIAESIWRMRYGSPN